MTKEIKPEDKHRTLKATAEVEKAVFEKGKKPRPKRVIPDLVYSREELTGVFAPSF